jgi:dTDP-glucose pyrophosphorylase
MGIKEIVKIFINAEDSIKTALEVIDKGGRGIALILDDEKRLIGTLTDGDIRRAILKGLSLDEPVKAVMNSNYVFVTRNYSRTLVTTIFQNRGIRQLPVLDDDMRVVDVIFYHEFFEEKAKENWALIMAGGLGTRLHPLTQEMPKPMLKVGAKPIIETIIEQLRSYGYKNIVLCLNYKADIIKNYFQDGANFGVNIKYVSERKRLGTAGAIRLAREYIDRPFFVLNGDILTKLNFDQFMQFHIKSGNTITIGTKKYEIQIPYGVVNLKDEKVIDLQEKPSSSYFISGGMYCLDPEAIDRIPEDEYFDITQLISGYLDRGEKVGSFPITEYWMDIGQIDDYHQANLDYGSMFRGEASAASG